MNKYFKKFSIMFVMLLAVIGIGTIQNGTEASASEILKIDNKWQMVDDSDKNIQYSDGLEGWNVAGTGYYKDTIHFSKGSAASWNAVNGYVKFNFYGTQLQLLGGALGTQFKDHTVTIDGITESVNVLDSNTQHSLSIFYEKKGLTEGIHSVYIDVKDSAQFGLDALNIDKNGYLLPYSKISSSIKLDHSAINLNIGDSQQLTATTTPAGVQVDWSSDNKEIATVDENGNVTGHIVGTATITGKIKGTDIKATCVVTVTPKGKEPTNPNTPVEPTGDGNLFIELVDGQIKSYQVTASQIEDFKQWYLDRDNTKSNKPYYHFTKGSYNDYVIHDKIDWFEVR